MRPVALTVRQPWASAIIYAGKDVENRSWTTSHRGRLYIHAGMRADPEEVLSPVIPTPRGVILGYVQLLDIVTNSKSRWAEPGQYHWLLANPVLLSTPVPAKGRLGLWSLNSVVALPRETSQDTVMGSGSQL
jgi:hypothetical protein